MDLAHLLALAMVRSAVILVALAACGDDLVPVPMFAKQTLDTTFRAEGAAIFDVNNDGHADIVTDQFWYAGPSYAAHEIRTPEEFDPHGYSKSVSAWGDDIDGDGWTDLVVAPFPTDAMYWYRNPEGLDGHWTAHLIAPALAAGMEQPIYDELFGDGRRVVIAGDETRGQIVYYAPATDPKAPWVAFPISAPAFGASYRFFHGLGAGDVDGDGRVDALTSIGWFAQGEQRTWTFHAFDFGANVCGTMFAHDLDGDDRADVLCPTPHAYGLYWWQQRADGTFEKRVVDEAISQMGALELADLDGDGVPELVSGKNWWAHPAGDPGTDDPAALVYYKTRPDGDGDIIVERHDVDDDSGIGRQVTVGDLDGNGKPDIVESTKKGLFVFLQR